jgi:choline dehydrogenase-like flavoprotein
MFIDARSLEDGAVLEAELCIVGAGAAGITLARALAGKERRVALIESGGFDFDDETQRLYEGETVGQAFTPLSVDRLRYLGGTTNHWSGTCRPFDAIDLEARPYVPGSGWPLAAADLDGYYRRAQEICQLGPYDYAPESWRGENFAPLDLGADSPLANGLYHYSPPTRFGEAYRRDLATAPSLSVYLHANLVDIETDADARSVTGLRLACLEGPRFEARARAYVLAAGGIENARLLLNADKVETRGLGNRFDLVGRYFMDHPYLANLATILLDQRRGALAFYAPRDIRGARVAGYLCPRPEAQRQEQLPGFAIGIEPGQLPDKEFAKASLLAVLRSLRSGHVPDHLAYHVGRVFRGVEWEVEAAYHRLLHDQSALYSTNYCCECPPDPESRVTLIDATDALGMRRVKLDWRLPSDFERHVRRAHELLGQALGRSGIGRLRLDFARDGADLRGRVQNAHHHMGTTRMRSDPRQGVVDANCRVHSVANLFIAGSSVFPTYSFDNPTMTIVALSLRLADHLREVLT